MDFKGFYDKIIFDVDKPILRKYTGKQGDTKSRGLYVTVTQRNVVIKDLTGLSMRLFYEKPDKTRGFIDGVVDGDKFRIDYTNQMFAVPGVVKAELRLMGANGEVITDKAFKISVDSSIADGSIISKDERGILDRAFELAEDIIPRLELLDVELLEDVQDEMLGARHSNTKDETYERLGQRLDASEQDLLDHKAEYTSNRQQDQLKIAKVEQELNDYKATMQQINIHQSPTQKASGHGIVSLPKNAANGQVSVSVKGNTETDEEGNTKSTVGAIRVKSVGKNLCPVNNVSNIDWGNSSAKAIFKNHIFYIDSGSYVFTAERDRGAVLRCYVFDDIDTLLSCRNGNSAFVKCRERIDLGGTASMSKKFLSKGYVLFGVFSSDASTVNATNIQLERGETATEYEPYKESNTYVIVKDEEGNILELRSLPNGTSDEINVTDRKLIKRIEEKSNIAKGMVIDFADMAEGGTYYAWNEDGETEAGVKGDTLGIDATELIYQLTIPVETPVQVSGSLVSYPSGTVYIEPFVADAGIYTNKMTVLHQDLPIKALEKLSKIDFMTGLETELDVSDAVIAEDKLSFTHPDLVDGDIVFYTYVYDKEGTEGETEIEYYDSRFVVKDDVTEKFYKWAVAVADGVPSIVLVEV